MTTFAYKARDMNGLLITGQMEGEALESVKLTLAEQGFIPISVGRGAKLFSKNQAADFFKGVKGEELMLFTRQFYTLFKAGMDMESLLATLANQTKNKYFADALNRVKTDVAAGSSLSQAFAKHPKIFDRLYVSMLATGEEAGILDEVLGQLSILLEKDTMLKSSVKSATLYPKIVIFVLVMASVVLMTFVVPKFASFYGHYKAELPLPTRIMIGTSNFLRDYTLMVVAGVGVGIFIFKKWSATARGRLIMDRFKWKVPVFGALMLKVANARFAHILGALYKAGLPITRGLQITAGTIANEAFSREMQIVQTEVERGKGIAEAMRQAQYLNPILIEATSIAEKSGSLDEMYEAVGSHFDMEVNHTLKNLTTMLEPILLGMIFGMITIFVLAIFLPIWNMSQVVMKH